MFKFDLEFGEILQIYLASDDRCGSVPNITLLVQTNQNNIMRKVPNFKSFNFGIIHQ